MWHISTVPLVTASAACRPGTISLEAKTWIWNLPSVMAATWSAMTWAAVKIVSSERGKLEVQRHLSSGAPCASAGLGNDPALAARPAAAAAVPPSSLRRTTIVSPPLAARPDRGRTVIHGRAPRKRRRTAAGLPAQPRSPTVPP